MVKMKNSEISEPLLAQNEGSAYEYQDVNTTHELSAPPYLSTPYHDDSKEDKNHLSSTSGKQTDNTNHSEKQNDTSLTSTRFNSPTVYQDKWASYLFGVCFLGYLFCFGSAIHQINISSQSVLNQSNSSNFNNDDLGEQKAKSVRITGSQIGAIGLGSLVFGFFMSILFLFALKKYTGKMIKASIAVNALLMGLLGIALLLNQLFIGFVLIVYGIFMVYFGYKVRDRIPFAKVMLQNFIEIMWYYPGTIYSSLTSVLLKIVFGVTYIVTLFGMILGIFANEYNNSQFVVGLVFASFATFWTMEVLKNIVHVTNSGVYASHYFSGRLASDPTISSAKRALTTSFGSICFGSLIIALFEMVRNLVRNGANGNARNGNIIGLFVLICISCFLKLLQDMIEYFNHYAFTQVAIYGKGFVDAAKSTWALIKSHGVDAIINDSLINIVIGLCHFSIGIFGAIFACIVVALNSNIPKEGPYFLMAALIGFILAIIPFGIVSDVIKSGMATTFVCLVEDPSALQRNSPELYFKIQEAYPQVITSLQI